MALVGITRDDLDSAGLRAAAAGTRDARQSRRLLALAMVLDGHPRLLAAQAGGMDRQTLRDWVHRYNAHGVEGLRGHARVYFVAHRGERVERLAKVGEVGDDVGCLFDGYRIHHKYVVIVGQKVGYADLT